MIKEHIAVYEAVKNTALHCEDGIRNARIYMYTVYFTLLTLFYTLLENSFDYRCVLYLSFFVLIAFQTMINNDSIAIQRASSFIRIFLKAKIMTCTGLY